MKQEFNTKEVREWVVGLLRDGITTITFEKTNGETRVMKCTLKQDLIPAEHTPNGTSEKEERDIMQVTALRVFDTEKQAWRSFKWDSITRIEFTIE